MRKTVVMSLLVFFLLNISSVQTLSYNPTVNNTTSILNVQFYDNGQSGDYKANDGIYTYMLRDTSSAGFYTVEVTASGQISGANFERKDIIGFEVVGEEKEEKKEAYFAGLIYNQNYAPGDTVSGFFYVGNEGNVAIDDEIHYTVKGPTGEWMYRKWEPIYLELGESEYKKIRWEIPTDAPSGFYHLMVEFDDPEIEGFPLSKWFWVSGLTLIGLPEKREKRKSKRILALILVLVVISQGCVQEQEKKVDETGKNLTQGVSLNATPQIETKEPFLPAQIDKNQSINESTFVSYKIEYITASVNKKIESYQGQGFIDDPITFGLFNSGGKIGISFYNRNSLVDYTPNNTEILVSSTDTHYVKLRYFYNFAVIEKISTSEFEEWDAKISVEDLGDSYLFNITYRKPIQNETEVQNLIVSFRDKKLVYLNATSYAIDWFASERYPGFGVERYLSSALIRDGKIYLDGRGYLNQDVGKIKNSILDDFISLNYTQESYEQIGRFMSEYGNLEYEAVEDVVLEFEDGSKIDVSYYFINTHIQGSLIIGDNQFFFSSTGTPPELEVSPFKIRSIIAGLVTKSRARINSMLEGFDYEAGEELWGTVYVTNIGRTDINDSMMLVIRDMNGEKIYEDHKTVILKTKKFEFPGESKYINFGWKVKEGLKPGDYTIEFGFADPEIDVLPSVKNFRID